MNIPKDPLAFVKVRLRDAGPKAWPAIAKSTGKPLSLIRKIAYGDRRNPRIDSLMPLLRHFERQEKTLAKGS